MSYKCDCACPHEADGKTHSIRSCYDQSCPRCHRCPVHMPWSGDCASCQPFDGAARQVTEKDVAQRRELHAFVALLDGKTPYPLHEKLAANHTRREAAQEMYDYLVETLGLHLAKVHEHTDECYGDSRSPQCGYFDGALEPWYESPEKIMAGLMDIDPKALEAEKRAMLDALRKQNG